MKNPLVLFVGAAVVAVAALAGATADRWQDWPGPILSTAANPDVVSVEAAEPAGEPESKLSPPAPETAEPPLELRREQPAETEAGPAPQETDEQVTAVGADDIESAEEIESPEAIESPPEIAEAPVEEPAVAPEEPTRELAKERAKPERLAAVDAREAQPTAPGAPAEPDTEPEASAQPSFDVVRLEEDGSLIVAGLAAPGARVTLLLDGEAIAGDAANDFGAWLLMPDAPLPPGSHQLMVQVRDAGSGAETSGTIAVAVPERAADRPRVAHSEPAQPPAAEDDVAAAPERAQSEEPARLEPEEPPLDEAEEEQVALAPVQEPDVEVAAPVVRESEPGESEAEPEEHAAVAPEAEVDLEIETEPETEAERRDIPLALETVDYNDEGEIVFSGRADPGGIVRIHVDNRFVGKTTADAHGRWAFAGGNRIAPGRHTLRADLIGADGNVVGRIILPFVRADGREVAALVEARREAVVQREPEAAPEMEAPEPAEAQAEPEPPVVAEEVAPEPEPEAPVVVDVAPEPEPEAPVVAEEVAPEPEPEPESPVADVAPKPEPEPEAPVVSDVAPEPEPEAPAVAEEVAPEPEPETPVVAEEVAPEPEPEAPVVVEEVVPEPEPEAPVVAEEVVPEPEPETPVVAEEVGPEPEPEAPVVADDATPVIHPGPEPETALTDQAAPEPDAADQMAVAEPEMTEPAEVDEPAVEEPAAKDGEPEVAAARPGHVVIQPGNNLWRISRVIYGRGIEYTAIYEANRDKIRDPDLIYPGQIFATPGVDPPKEIDPEWREPLTPEDLARQDAGE